MIMEKQRYDLGATIDFLKNIGIVVGSLGSLAVLFFWLGNAIIVARLRAYNLYGLVHYTDEYIKEAGNKFIQDVFTFFQDWRLIIVFIIAMCILFSLIPLGPFIRKEGLKPSRQEVIKKPFLTLIWIRQGGIHYILFLLSALSACISLTTPWGVKNLPSDILRQERLLSDTINTVKNRLPFFELLKDAEPDEFQKGIRIWELISR